MKNTVLLAVITLSLYLGIHNGNLALWETDHSIPLKVFPYSASLYTHIDQIELNNGIYIQSNPDLMKLLDDYLS